MGEGPRDRFSDDTIKIMEWARPYEASKEKLHPLRVLQVLSNTDKHRLLNVVENAHIEQGIRLVPERRCTTFGL